MLCACNDTQRRTCKRALKVREDELEQLHDGEGDTLGLAWHTHVRDRLAVGLAATLFCAALHCALPRSCIACTL